MSKINSSEIQNFIDTNLTGDFFKFNPIGKMSSYMILDFTISVEAMDQQIYNMMSQESKSKVDEENINIEQLQDMDKLYSMLRREMNPISVNLVIKKLLEQEEFVAPKLLQDLKNSGNDFFVEGSAKFIMRAEKNYEEELKAILNNAKYPYAKSMICYLLGKLGNEDCIELMYKQFIELKEKYQADNFFEGPLFALHEMKRRFEF